MSDRSGYIGRAPGDSSVIIANQTFEPTGIQTNFTFASGYTPGYLDVYLNGSRLVYANDYTATDGSTVGLTTFANSGDVIECVAYKAFNLGSINNAGGNFTVSQNLTVNGDTTATDINATGIVTASSFSGDGSALTGMASTDNIITGTAVTITNTTNSTSTTTGALQVSGGVGVALSMTVGGSLSVGGTITYEDVTNVDSIGLATFRSGVQFGASGIGGTIRSNGDTTLAGVVTATSFVGDGSGLTNLVGAGVTSNVNTVNLNVISGISSFGGNVQFGAAGVGGTIRANGDTTLVGVLTATKMVVNENSAFNDADEYLLVKNTGAACNISVVGGTSNHSSVNLGDTDDFNIQKIRSGHSDNSLAFFTDNTSRLHLDNSGRIGINTTTFGDAREALRVQSPPGQTGTFLTILSNEGASSQIFFGDNDFNEGRIDYDHSTNTMGLYTNDAERCLVWDDGIKVSGVTSTTDLTLAGGIVQEKFTAEGTALTGTYNWDMEDNGGIANYTSNASGTWIWNLRGDGSTTLNSLMHIGMQLVFTGYVPSNNASYYMTDLKIDGSSQTEKWNGGSAPSAGTGSGTDVYTFNILKTADATFTVFANFSNFA